MTTKERVEQYYDQEAADYIHMYEKNYISYPANAIRLELISKRISETKAKSILDAGCGTCGPLIHFLNKGFFCEGFDFSESMVENGRKELEKEGYDPKIISVGDLETDTDISDKLFDAVIALGVFPHISNEKKALLNMKNILYPNGKVYVEFRNSLFGAYTLNKYSIDFFLNDVINVDSLDADIKKNVENFYIEKLDVDKEIKNKDGKLHYTEILAKFKNPLTISKELFEPCGFHVDDVLFYHYHALPPVFQDKYPEQFKKLCLKLEDPHDWRGHLMASAFVVEATKLD